MSHDKRPLILVSNDDGVSALGIITLAKALASIAKVVVVAPVVDQSAVSHAMSLNRPLRLSTHPSIVLDSSSIDVFSVDGTPTDAVYMAAHHILRDTPPDLVVSGINHGANLADDVLYSGTVSAAMEGAFFGIPAVAVSAVGKNTFDFDTSARFAQSLCASLLKNPLPNRILLNVNVPKDAKPDTYAITRLGYHHYDTDVEERKDPRGRSYFWIGGAWSGFSDVKGSDCKAIANGLISVTPIEVDLTSKHMLSWLGELKVNNFKANSFFRDDV